MFQDIIQGTIYLVVCLIGFMLLVIMTVLINSFMPSKEYEKELMASSTENIGFYFGFLIEKGYQIRETEYGHKFIKLVSKDCIISISQDRGDVLVRFSPVFADDYTNQFDIETMVYYLSQGENYIGYTGKTSKESASRQFANSAGLLKEYIDQIVPCFGDKYQEYYKDELKKAQRKYGDRQIAEIRQEIESERA